MLFKLEVTHSEHPFHQGCSGGRMKSFLLTTCIHKLTFVRVSLTFHIFPVFFFSRPLSSWTTALCLTVARVCRRTWSGCGADQSFLVCVKITPEASEVPL